MNFNPHTMVGLVHTFVRSVATQCCSSSWRKSPMAASVLNRRAEQANKRSGHSRFHGGTRHHLRRRIASTPVLDLISSSVLPVSPASTMYPKSPRSMATRTTAC